MLKPLSKPKKDCWFSSLPLGHNTLDNMVKKMCEAAKIHGFRTNHSLRAITTTRLYQAGIDEQLIMERTGHRSIDGVRSYKQTSDEQREALSDIINCTHDRKQPRLTSCSQSQQLSVAPGQIMLSNCNNVTLNIIYN